MGGTTGSIMDIPSPILTDILTRLSIKSILTCRSVCKTWFNLISDPHFTKVHSAGSPPVELMLRANSPKLVWRNFYLIELQSHVPHNSKLHPHISFNAQHMNPDHDYGVVNSCNGLICLRETSSRIPVYVCNSITNEYICLPNPIEDRYMITVIGSGFGFSPRSNQYKVLRMLFRRIHGGGSVRRAVEIYTLGTESWRSIRVGISFGAYSPPWMMSFPTFLNGAIHWVGDERDSSDFILSFDFDNEQFLTFPPPPHFGANHRKTMHKMTMGMLGGCLYVCDRSCGGRVDIWVMKEYGVKESWTKEFVIDTLMLPTGLYQPIKFMNNGELLIFQGYNALVLYHPIKRSVRCIMIHGIHIDFEAIALIPSFVSLKDAIVGDNVQVLKVESRFAESKQLDDTEALSLVEDEFI